MLQDFAAISAALEKDEPFSMPFAHDMSDEETEAAMRVASSTGWVATRDVTEMRWDFKKIGGGGMRSFGRREIFHSTKPAHK